MPDRETHLDAGHFEEKAISWIDGLVDLPSAERRIETTVFAEDRETLNLTLFDVSETSVELTLDRVAMLRAHLDWADQLLRSRA